MKNPGLVKTKTETICEECKATFASSKEAEAHHHVLNTVSSSPPVFMLLLPPGVNPGEWKAAESFAKGFAELREKHPGREFQFLPFGYQRDSNGVIASLDCILAVDSDERPCSCKCGLPPAEDTSLPGAGGAPRKR